MPLRTVAAPSPTHLWLAQKFRELISRRICESACMKLQLGYFMVIFIKLEIISQLCCVKPQLCYTSSS